MNAYDDVEPDPYDDCPACGSGGIAWDEEINDFDPLEQNCPQCNGTGRAAA